MIYPALSKELDALRRSQGFIPRANNIYAKDGLIVLVTGSLYRKEGDRWIYFDADPITKIGITRLKQYLTL